MKKYTAPLKFINVSMHIISKGGIPLKGDMRKMGYEKYIKKAKDLRKQSKCLFEDIATPCLSNGKNSLEKNHIIAKSHLKRIAQNDQVMVFAWEERDYYKNKGRLSKRNIKNANVYMVLCGNHDKLLFDEIERGNDYQGSLKQNYQFALRAFLFSYSHLQIKQDSCYDRLTSHTATNVSTVHYALEATTLEQFKQTYSQSQWEAVTTIRIELNRQINFISCFYGQPFYNISFPVLLTSEKLAINIFPNADTAIILLSYLGDSKVIKRYCHTLKKYAERSEIKFLNYMSKLVISCDPNIAINPVFWEGLTEESKESFYYCAHIFKKNKSIFGGFKSIFKLYFHNCKCNLFSC